MLVACQAKELVNSNSEASSAEKFVNMGTLHNEILGEVYKELYKGYSNNVVMDSTNVNSFFSGILIDLLIKKGFITDVTEFEGIITFPMETINVADPISNVLSSTKTLVLQAYNSGKIDEIEQNLLFDLLLILENKDYNKCYEQLIDFKNNLIKDNYYGNLTIVSYSIDVAVHSAEYWQDNFSDWSDLMCSIYPAGNHSRDMATGVFILDVVGTIGAGIDNIVDENGVVGSAINVVVGAVSFSYGKIVSIALTVGDWIFN